MAGTLVFPLRKPDSGYLNELVSPVSSIALCLHLHRVLELGGKAHETMNRIVSCYGSKKRRMGVCIGSLSDALENVHVEETVSEEKLTWKDVGNDYIDVENERPLVPRNQSEIGMIPLQNAKQDAEEKKKDEKALAAMVKRRMVSKKNCRQTKEDKQTQNLLELCMEWRTWNDQSTLFAASQKGRAKPKKFNEESACEKAMSYIKLNAGSCSHSPCGTTALLCMASISTTEAHKVLRAMIESGADLRCEDQFSCKGAVDVALENGNVWAVRALIRKVHSQIRRVYSKEYLLCFALKQKKNLCGRVNNCPDLHLCARLIERLQGGLPLVCPSNTEGVSSLMQFAVMHRFVMEGIKFMSSAVFDAVANNDAGSVGVLLSHGLKPEIVLEGDSLRRTPILVCVEGGHSVSVARVLLEKGADANGKDAIGVPLAMYALLRQERAMFALLAKHGLKPDLCEDSSGESVYEAALNNGWTLDELDHLFPDYNAE